MPFHYTTETYLIKEIKEHNRFTNFLKPGNTIQFIGYREPSDLHAVNQPKMLMRAVVSGKPTEHVMTETKAMNILTKYTTIAAIHTPNLETIRNAEMKPINMKDEFIPISTFVDKIKFNTVIHQQVLKETNKDAIIDVDCIYHRFNDPKLVIKILYSIDYRFYLVKYKIDTDRNNNIVYAETEAYVITKK